MGEIQVYVGFLRDEVYVKVKDDGCGQCPHNPWTAMRDALNKTGRKMWYAIHAGNCEDWSQPVTCVNGSVANMWRTGGDLSASTFDMWTNREYCKRCLLAQALRHLCVFVHS